MEPHEHNKEEEAVFKVLPHPDMKAMQELIRETCDGRSAVSIVGRGGRIIATLVLYEEDGSFSGVQEFSSKAKTTDTELHDVLKSIQGYITEKRTRE